LNDRRQIESFVFSGHAVRQMFARSISADDIRTVIDEGEVIASYPDDRPYPSDLLLGFSAGRPLHVILAYNEVTRIAYVVTAYVPDPKLWSEDYKTRGKP
jgi:hypothetical protein